MQIKKEDMQQTILQCAKEEFAKRGYENASMRLIAKKANTSLGNIYHYYPNKRTILDCLLIPTVEQLSRYVHDHIVYAYEIQDMREINDVIENADYYSSDMQMLFSNEFVIFMDTKEDDYVEQREELLALLRKHIAWHMKFDDPENHFVIIVTKMIVDCVKHIASCNECFQDKKQDTVELFKMLCRSVAGLEIAFTKNENKE